MNKDDEDSYKLVQFPVSPSIPAQTTDFADCNSSDYNDEEDPTSQLLTEYWMSFLASIQDEFSLQIAAVDTVNTPPYASFPANNQDDPFMQISTVDNGYTSPNALTFSIITHRNHQRTFCFHLSQVKILMTLMYVVIGGLTGHERKLLILLKSRARLIINLMRERLTGNIRVKALCLPFTVGEIC